MTEDDIKYNFNQSGTDSLQGKYSQQFVLIIFSSVLAPPMLDYVRVIDFRIIII